MFESIQLNGYKKACLNPLKLSRLQKINYLVGENGSGKTSLIEILCHLINLSVSHSHNRQNDFQTNFFANFGTASELFDKSKFELYIKYDLNISIVTDLRVNILSINYPKVEFRSLINNSINYQAFLFTDEKYINRLGKESDNYIFKNLNTSLDEFNHITAHDLKDFINAENLLGQHVTRIYRSIDSSKEILIELNNNPENPIALKSLSQGQIQFIILYSQLSNLIIEYNKNNHRPLLIFIEEPEKYFHPLLQKRLHVIFQNLCINYPKLTFIISTHSPFIISKASEDTNTKVYLFKDGTTSDVNGNLMQGEEGFQGSEVLKVASKLLGADHQDFGYPENYCLLEESSLQAILEDLKDRKWLKPWKFISCGGWDRALKVERRIEDLSSSSILLTCNPMYQDKYVVILDKVHPDKASLDKYVSLKNKLQPLGRFFELEEDSIESYYPEEFKVKYKDLFEIATLGEGKKEGQRKLIWQKILLKKN